MNSRSEGHSGERFDGRVPAIKSFTVAAARRYIAEVRWQFAKTMPQWPHQYTVRSWRPDLEAEFEAFARLIRSEGTVAPWPRDSSNPRYTNAYLVIGEWMYWTMPDTIAEQGVINRAEPDLPANVPCGRRSQRPLSRSTNSGR